MRPLELYAIADRATLEARGLPLRLFAEHLRDAGVRQLQYRDKVGGPQEVLRSCREIEEVFAGTNARLLVNDRADLAALLCWGVHVGQDDLPVEDALRLVRTVGVSTHNEHQLRAADASGAKYIAIGPVFGTTTKPDAEPVVGLEGVRRARALTRKPLVAIGGITLANARDIVEAGADSVAVISGLFVEGRSVAEVARDFLEVLR